jgi:hypothetical protein
MKDSEIKSLAEFCDKFHLQIEAYKLLFNQTLDDFSHLSDEEAREAAIIAIATQSSIDAVEHLASEFERRAAQTLEQRQADKKAAAERSNK